MAARSVSSMLAKKGQGVEGPTLLIGPSSQAGIGEDAPRGRQRVRGGFAQGSRGKKDASQDGDSESTPVHTQQSSKVGGNKGRSSSQAGATKRGTSSSAQDGMPKKKGAPTKSKKCGRAVCGLCNAVWANGMPWGKLITKVVPDGSTVTEPQGDFCATCVFLPKSFAVEVEKLQEQVQTDKQVQANVEEARASSADLKARSFPLEGVKGFGECVVRAKRKWEFLTEKELAKIMRKTKVPKTVADKIPQIMLPSEDTPGEMEVNFCFRRHDKPYKYGGFESVSGIARDVHHMTPETHLWANQGGQFFKQRAKVFEKDSGLKTVHAKPIHKHMSLEDFLGTCVAGDEQPADSLPDDVSDEGLDPMRTRVGASTPVKGAMQLSVPQLSPVSLPGPPYDAVCDLAVGDPQSAAAVSVSGMALKTLGSLESLAQSDREEDGAEADGCETLVAVSEACEKLPADLDSKLDGLIQEDPSGQLLLKYWNRKLPTRAAVENVYDGRTFVGMKRALQRLKKKRERDDTLETACDVFEGYYNVILLCIEVQPQKILGLPLDEMKPKIVSLVKNLKHCPDCVLNAVLNKNIIQLKAQGEYIQILNTCSPIMGSESKVNPLHPKLCNLEGTDKTRVAFFEQVYVTRVLCPLIKLGQEESGQVQQIVDHAKHLFDDLDVVTCSKHLSEQQLRCYILATTIPTIKSGTFDPEVVSEVAEFVGGQDDKHGSLMLTVARALDSNAWWNQRLVKFEESKAAVLQHGALFMEHEEELANILADENLDFAVATTHLQKIYTALAIASPKMPEEPMAAFREKVSKATAKLTKCMIQTFKNEGKLTGPGLPELEKLLSEAMIAFPESNEILQLVESVAGVQRQTSASEAVSRLTSVWAPLKAKLDDIDKLVESDVKDFHEALSQCHGKAIHGVDENLAGAQEMYRFTADAFVTHLAKSDYVVSSLVHSLCVGLAQLLVGFGVKTYTHQDKLIQLVRDTALCREQVVDINDAGMVSKAKTNKYKDAAALEAVAKKLEAYVGKNAEKTYSKCAQEIAKALVSDAAQLAKTIWTERSKEAKAELEGASQSLQAKVLFGEEGNQKSWHDGADFKKLTLESMYKMAVATHFTVPDEEMSKTLDMWENAKTKYEAALQAVGQAGQIEELMKEHKNIYETARAQKLLSAAMLIVKKTSTSEEDIASLKAMIEDARKHGVDEKKELPQKLYEKVLKKMMRR